MSYGALMLADARRLRDASSDVITRDYWTFECWVWASVLLAGPSA